MIRRIPPDAFEQYMAMPDPSYERLGKTFGVSKRSIVKRATKEHWQERLAAIRAQANSKTDARAAESLEAMKSRHLRTISAVMGRALEALKSMPLDSSMDAVRAIDLAMKQERAIRGSESEDAAGRTVEQTSREEVQRLLRLGPVDPNNPYDY